MLTEQFSLLISGGGAFESLLTNTQTLYVWKYKCGYNYKGTQLKGGVWEGRGQGWVGPGRSQRETREESGRGQGRVREGWGRDGEQSRRSLGGAERSGRSREEVREGLGWVREGSGRGQVSK